MSPNHQTVAPKPLVRARKVASRILVLILTTCTITGCRTINKRITEAVLDGGEAKQWHIHYGSTLRYRLNNQSLEKIAFEGTVDAERIRVRYQKGLRNQAERIANEAVEMLERVERRIGMTITTRSTIQLLRFDEPPQNFSICLTVDPNEFPLPLFVRAGDESYRAILAQNPSYPYLFVHELVETSLVCDRSGGQVLPDLGWGALGLNAHVNNYTRWFRDGLANYAGFIAQRIITEDLTPQEPPPLAEPILHSRPFSSLSAIRGKLFTWPQSAAKDKQREYYDAALGLFLLLENRFGEQAIRQIMQQVAGRQAVDRHDLVEITNQAIGTDVKQFVAEFRFPQPGLEVSRITPALVLNQGLEVEKGLFVNAVEPNSPGERVGLQVRDVILAAGSTRVTGELDFELALFGARQQTSLSLAVRRPDEGTIAVEMPLQSADETMTASGKRRRPLKKGQIDLLGPSLLMR